MSVGGGGLLCEAEYFFLPIKLVSIHSKGSPYCLVLEFEVFVRPCLYACVSVVCACVRVCMRVSSTDPQYYHTCRLLRCGACVCVCVHTCRHLRFVYLSVSISAHLISKRPLTCGSGDQYEYWASLKTNPGNMSTSLPNLSENKKAFQ